MTDIDIAIEAARRGAAILLKHWEHIGKEDADIKARHDWVSAADRESEAAIVAERILNENIVTTNWNKTIQNGSLRQGSHDFRWTLRNDPWTQDPNQNVIRRYSVEVLFVAQGRDYTVCCRTQ